MACNQRIIYKYNNYITKKIPYIKMLIRIRIIELSKKPLSIACRGKEKN